MFAQNPIQEAEEFLKRYELDSLKTHIFQIDTLQLTQLDLGKFYYIQGQYHLKKDVHDKAFSNFLKSKKIFTSLDSLNLVADSDLNIIETLAHQRNTKISKEPFLNSYLAIANRDGDPKKVGYGYAKIAVTYLDADSTKTALYYFDKAIEKAYEAKDTLLVASFKFNKGVVYNTSGKEYSRALSLFQEVLPVFEKYEMKEYVSFNYNNQAEAYKKLGRYSQALDLYKKAFAIDLRVNSKKTKKLFLENTLDLYQKMGDYKKAFTTSQSLLSLKDSIDNQSQNNAIAEAENKYRASEKERENLVLNAEKKRNQNIAIGLGGSLILGSIIAILIYRDTKRKQRIAEQGKELEIQKTTTILKEQEITTINAMIEGQEKERLRLAGDLHDNIGGTLAAIKMHIGSLQNNLNNSENPQELLDKTNELISDAYQKVRGIAHERNSGVMAKEGLLPAVQKLASKISAANRLQVDVEDFGLENRLSNNLEITIFRIIQELITNIIKHANATEASISLTQYDDELNIIVEDNGRGFKVGKLEDKDGMGLGSIERRIEHLEGTMQVDSTPGKGTNVLIDIPL